MAGKKDPSNPSRFKKGQSGNPAGSSKRYRELKGLQQLSHLEVCQLGTQLLAGSINDLSAVREEPNVSVHRLWLAKLIANAITTDNHRAYHMLMDRIVGKPREYQRIEHTGVDGGPIRTEAEPTEEAMRAELLAIQAARKETAD